MDVASLQQPADLARLLCGWRSVWHEVGKAASAPLAAAPARDELHHMAGQAERWLQADLVDLGQPSEPARCTGTESGRSEELAALLADPASSWGVTYVLRGSRLGGTVLAPLVRAALGPRSPRGTAFLASEGTDPGREWVMFRRRLDGVDLTADQLVTTIDAAGWTFRWVGSVTAGRPRIASSTGVALLTWPESLRASRAGRR